ncbi:hypothetical protein V499_07934 [Pseudogymnoascus sp. VKM F-103]|nr:hypothetical protein V499_07934 [Pseudogymnoascus sp. VKM F-103]
MKANKLTITHNPTLNTNTASRMKDAHNTAIQQKPTSNSPDPYPKGDIQPGRHPFRGEFVAPPTSYITVPAAPQKRHRPRKEDTSARTERGKKANLPRFERGRNRSTDTAATTVPAYHPPQGCRLTYAPRRRGAEGSPGRCNTESPPSRRTHESAKRASPGATNTDEPTLNNPQPILHRLAAHRSMGRGMFHGPAGGGMFVWCVVVTPGDGASARVSLGAAPA